ncbi:MAG: branched-chain amino acid ABC transporter permease [Actinomycetota bacterium]
MPVGRFVRTGLVGGTVLLFVALTGLLAKVAEINLIGTQVTGARVLLMFAPFLAGYVAVRPRVVAGRLEESTPFSAAMSGAIAGLAAGGLIAAASLFTDRYGVERVREVFVQVDPGLLETVAFGSSVIVGAVILTAGGALVGAAGGAFRTLAPSLRRPIGTALGVTVLAGLLQRIIPIALIQLGIKADWLYSPATSGLTWLGAFLILVGSLGFSRLWVRGGMAARDTVRAIVREQPSAKVIVVLVAIGVLATVPLLLGAVISEVLGTVMVFMLLGLGLNIVVGYAGLLDLGYVAFFGFGAYAMALLTGGTLNTTTGSAAPAFGMDLNFYVAIPIVVLLAAGVGLLIGAPVLRLRGDYLAIVTLGLGEMVSILISSNWLKPLVGGPQGMRNITDAEIAGFSFRDPQHFFYLALAFMLLAAFVSWRLANSRIGRAWNAMREDEQVADAMGISTTRFKLLAFATGGAVGSVGGALFAVKIGSLAPSSFEIIVSITALAIVILGGMGSIPGVVVGALVLIGLPGLLREFEEFRLLIYGAALVSIMILRPQGIVPNIRRSRELQEEDRSQDKWAGNLAVDEDVAAAISPIGEGSG